MAKFPAMPFWFDSYMLDCGHLSDAEHGRYLLLMKELWTAPRQRIPNDNEWLARHFRRSVEAVEKELRPLIAEFCQCDGNWIWQKRISQEFAHVSERSQKQSDRAKARWKKEKPFSRGNASEPDAAAMPPLPIDSSLRSESQESPPASVPPPMPEPEPEVSPSRKRSGRAVAQAQGSRLPEGWRPTEDELRFAAGVGLDPVAVSREAEVFRDYWHGKAGEKGRKADWPATWRNWVRRAADQRRQRDGPRSAILDGYAMGIQLNRTNDDDDAEIQPRTLLGLPH